MRFITRVLLCVGLSAMPFVSGASTPSPLTKPMARSGAVRTQAVSPMIVADELHVFDCRTHAEFEAQTCVEPSLAQQFNASAFDSLIGGAVTFDYVVQQYDFRFTAPDGVITEYKWNLEPASFANCPGAYYNVYADGLAIWRTCYDGGVYQGNFPYRKAGNWKIELLEDGVVKWTAFAALKEAEIRKDSGDGQTGLTSKPLRVAPVYSLHHFDGATVDAAESSHGTPTNVAFTVTGPANAGGTASSAAYPDHGTSQTLNVTLGSKVGTYTVNGILTGAKMASPFTFTAALRLTPDDHKDKQEGNGDDSCSVADPITLGLGNSFQREVDYARTGLSPLEFMRSYNAFGLKSAQMKNYWTTSFDMNVDLTAAAGGAYFVRRPDGHTVPFYLINGAYITRPYFHGVFRPNGSGWQYVTEDNVTENYDSLGHWTSIVDAEGRTLTATYTKGLLTKVAANTGEFLNFTYNTFNQLATTTDQANRVWTYTYDGYSNLTQVKQPDGIYRNYHYESSASPFLITGVSVGQTAIPQVGDRYVTWEFDSAGRASANYLGNYYSGYVKRFDIAYNDVDGSRIVTDGVHNQDVYKTELVNGRGFVDGVVGPGFSSCGLADSEIVRDGSMHVASSTAFGRVTQFGNYDTKGQYGFKIEAAGKTDAKRTDYSYDARFVGKPALITEPSVAPGKFKTTQFTYDAAGHVTQNAIFGFKPDGTPVSRAVTMQYSGPYGQLSQIDGPRTDVADIVYFDYNPTTKRLLRVTGANGVVERNNITYTTTGNVASEDRPNGVHVVYSYYAGSDLLKSVTESATGTSRSTTWTYTDRRFVQSLTFSDGKNPDLVTNFTYNAAGDLTTLSSPGAGQITYGYDLAGNRVRDGFSNPSEGREYRWLQRTFDAYGRVQELINPDNAAFTYFHPEGTLTHATDGRGNDTSYQYDDFKRLTQVVQPGQFSTGFGYDVQDHLTSAADANQATTLQSYDDLGNRLRLDSPDTGITTFSYDTAGNQVGAKDALSQATTSTYDTGNRIKTVDRVGAADDESYVYDNCTNGADKLCSVINGIGDFVRYEYDPLGRITKQTTNAGVVSYQHDASGAVTDVTYPSQRTVHFRHNAGGETTEVSVTDGSNTYVLARNIVHLPFGPARSWVDGSGITETRQYDQQYRPVSFTTSGVGTVSYDSYDGNSNVLQRSVYGDVQGFTYDALDHLQTASGPFGTREYAYDPVGNRTSLNADGHTTLSNYQPQSNRLLSDTQWTYARDADGNETQRKAADGHGWDLTSTANNRLLGITDVQNPNTVWGAYRYNALGQRTVKSTPYGDTRFIYGLSGELLADLTPEGSVTQEYVYLDGALIALLGVPTASDAPFAMDQITDNPASDPNCVKKNANIAVNGSYLQCAVGTQWFYLGWPWTAPVSGDYDVSVYVAWTSTQQCYSFINDEIICTAAGIAAGNWLSLGRHHIDAGVGGESIDSPRNTSAIKMDAVRHVLMHKDLTDRDYKYVHTDALGAPLRVTDKTGTIVWQASYDPFGAATVNDDPDGNGIHQAMNLRFPGQYYDAESGLHYNYFRNYDPTNGRYLQSDPIGLTGGANTFAYSSANPANVVDPLGLRALTDCEKGKLGPYVPKVDLESADLHDGEQPWWLYDKEHNVGVTVNNDIYFRAGEYDPDTPDGLSTLAHELFHVGQYRNGVMTPGSYLFEAVLHGSLRANKYEKPAYNFGDRVRSDLTKNWKGGCGCEQP